MLAFLLKTAFPLGNEIGGDYFLLAGFGLLPVGLATFLAINHAALRSRRNETGELYASLSSPPCARTLAHLGSAAAPVLLGAVVVAIGFTAIGAWDGVVVDSSGMEARPGPAELASGPAAVAMLAALGVALARWLPHLPVGAVAAVGIFAAQVPGTWDTSMPHVWFMPFVNPARSAPGTSWPCAPANGPCYVERFETSAVGWHLLYLAGITLLLAAFALRQESRRSRAVALGALGAILAVTGGILQVP